MRIVAIIIMATTLITASPFAAKRQTAKSAAPLVEFSNITRSASITLAIARLAPGIKYLIETMGGGGGFIDYNGDGLLDIYLVCYSQTPQPDTNTKLKDVLYRNNGDGTFTDVTERAGINNSMLGMGLAVGDFDNDGWP